MASQICAATASDDSLETTTNTTDNLKAPVKEGSENSKKPQMNEHFTALYTPEQQQQLFLQELESRRFRTQLMREEFEASQTRLDELHKLKLANERRLAEEQVFELKDARLKEEKRLEELHQLQLQSERNRGQQSLYNLQAANKRALTHENELHKLQAAHQGLGNQPNPKNDTVDPAQKSAPIRTNLATDGALGDDFGWGDWGTTKKKKKKTSLTLATKDLMEPSKSLAPTPPPVPIPGWWKCSFCKLQFDPTKEESKRFCPKCGFTRKVPISYNVL